MNLKKCYCTKTHIRQFNKVTYKFNKNEEYNYIDTLLSYRVLTDSYDFEKQIQENFYNFYDYKNFEKYFTDDIKYIRKAKLNKLKNISND